VAWAVRSLVDFARQRGCDADAVLRAADIDPAALDDPDLRIEDAAGRHAWETAIALTGESDLGLAVAGAQPAGSFDMLEYAFRASPTLRRAFEQLARFRRVVRDDLEVTIEEDGSRVDVIFTLREGGPLLRQQANYFLFGWLRIAREATGRSDLAPLETRVPYSAPARLDRIEWAFRGPMRFDCAEGALVFDREAMALCLTRSDPDLVRVLGRHLSRREPRPVEETSFTAAVRSRLAEDLASGTVTASRVAAELGLGVRTLDRRLNAEGTSFRAVLDDVRREAAERYLKDRRVSLGEAAFLLGYSEASALHRSFRRWTGQTPHEFRRALPVSLGAGSRSAAAAPRS